MVQFHGVKALPHHEEHIDLGHPEVDENMIVELLEHERIGSKRTRRLDLIEVLVRSLPEWREAYRMLKTPES